MNRRASSKRSPAPQIIGGIDPDALKIQSQQHKKLLTSNRESEGRFEIDSKSSLGGFTACGKMLFFCDAGACR
jgi:hypothetical protein